mmetsp:Transcript_2366/g.3972  ORF Transcript_2366/g.3972 Transcript_2366/m.3972 type:complete len:242 (+) Transcript_2366:434-1159(+)
MFRCRELFTERAIAKAIQKGVISRAGLFLQTTYTAYKGQDPNNCPYDPKSPLASQVAVSFAISQRNLKTEYVDSLVMHSPLESYEDTLSVWRAMEEIHARGGARQLGISNAYDLKLLKDLYADATTKPAVIQNRFYPESGHDKDIRAWCEQNNIRYQSFWTLTGNKEILLSKALVRISNEKRRTPAQIFYRFTMQQGSTPLSGTTDPQHMREDLEVSGRFQGGFSLSDEELSAIAELTYAS